jgi:hypothetical protein
MNLEDVEERCINYLRQAANPLVSVHTLLEYCRREPSCAELSEQELIDFLRPHELVRVVDPPPPEDPVQLGVYAESGLDMGPRAILKARMPSPREAATIMDSQLDNMLSALGKALEEADRAQQTEMAARIRETIQRTELLREKARGLL